MRAERKAVEAERAAVSAVAATAEGEECAAGGKKPLSTRAPGEMIADRGKASEEGQGPAATRLRMEQPVPSLFFLFHFFIFSIKQN